MKKLVFPELARKYEQDARIEHVPKTIPQEIIDFATDTVLLKSRYMFTKTEKGVRTGYCTHCRTVSEIDKSYKVKDVIECPNCNSECVMKDAGRSRNRMSDYGYLVHYAKSIIDSRVIVAYGVAVWRDYRKTYKDVDTKYNLSALYIFEPGKAVMLIDYFDYKMGDYRLEPTKTCYSLYGHFSGTTKKMCNIESITTAVAGTQFQYSTWDSYSAYGEDYTKFFDLYAKYPCVEYLTKIGLKELVRAKINGWRTYGVVEWRGTNIEKILRLPKPEIKKIIKSNLNAFDKVQFLRLKQLALKTKINPSEEECEWLIKNSCDTEVLKKIMKYTGIKRIIPYLKKQKTEMPLYSTDGILNCWRDYIVDCEVLEMNLSDSRILFPKNVFTAHQETSKRIKSEENQLMDKKIEKRLPSLARYCFEYQGFFIRPAASTKEMIAEGKALNICVGTYAQGYMTRHANGKTTILLIRRKEEPEKPYFTMEVRNEEIIQVQGKKHCLPDGEVKVFVEQFEKHCLKKKAKAS